jgi:hypothetical protein
MNLPHSVRPHVGGEGNEGFWSGKGFLKGLNKINCGETKGFEETFHLNFFLTDARKKLDIIFRPLRIRIEADMERLVPVRNRFSNGLEDTLYPSEGHLFSASDGFQR